MKKKLIIIGGGMGPMAGVELQRLIISHTPTNGFDQEHIEVHHFSRAHDISDRPAYLLKGIGENPAYGMLRTILAAKASATEVDADMVIGIPCITFHADPIFQTFLSLLNENNIECKVVNIITETADFLKDHYPSIHKVGILSTTATQKTGVLHMALEGNGLKVVELDDERQKVVQASISNPDWGIKSNFPISEQANQNFHQFAKELIDLGAEAIILGCTEIPLVFPEKEFKGIPLVNPVEVLAKALIASLSK